MKKFLSPKDIQEITGLGRGGVYALFNFPGFPSVKIGKKYFVLEDDFYEWINRGGTKQADQMNQ